MRIIVEQGLAYDSSLMADDDCYELLADGGPTGVVELPVEWIRDDAVYFTMERYASLRPYTPPRDVLTLWRDEFDAARADGGLFELTMHPHIIGHRSRMVVLTELLDHITSFDDVWYATHAQVVDHVRTAMSASGDETRDHGARRLDGILLTVSPTTTRLRELLASEGPLLLPGAPNALTARVIEETGYQAAYVSGAGVTNTYLGMPDIGLLSLSELVDDVSAMANAVSIPLVVDADTGFGNALNVQHTVRKLERAGAAAIQIEDQVSPKKWGHFTGTEGVSRDEKLGKVRAAVDARDDADLVIIARTDARSTEGIEAACNRRVVPRRRRRRALRGGAAQHRGDAVRDPAGAGTAPGEHGRGRAHAAAAAGDPGRAWLRDGAVCQRRAARRRDRHAQRARAPVQARRHP